MASPSRPTSVVVLSVLFFILGILLFLPGTMEYVAYEIVMDYPPGMTPAKSKPYVKTPSFFCGLWFDFVFHGVQLLAVTRVGMGLIFVVASTPFYRRRGWARWIMEMGSWNGVMTMVFFSLWFIGMSVRLFLQMPASEDPHMALLFLLMMVGMAVFNPVLRGTIQGIILYELRRPKVCEAMI